MDLLPRYLKAVESYLPVKQPKDILRELGENIQSQMDDQAEKLGRPLTEAEQAAVLKQVGNPALVAGRYHTSDLSVAFGRQLIGPGLFPLYARVLAIALGSAFAARSLVGLWLGQPVLEALFSGLALLVWPFVIVTAVFASLQSVLNRNPDLWNAWDPQQPPTRISDAQWVSRLESLVEFVVIAAILLWLRSDFIVGFLEQIDQNLAPAWRQVYLLLVMVTAASLVPPLVNLFRPRWVLFRQVTRLIISAVCVGGLLYLLLAADWQGSANNAAEVGRAAGALSRYMWYGVLLTAAGAAISLVWEAVSLWRRKAR